jgi:hypothetical protein
MSPSVDLTYMKHTKLLPFTHDRTYHFAVDFPITKSKAHSKNGSYVVDFKNAIVQL